MELLPNKTDRKHRERERIGSKNQKINNRRVTVVYPSFIKDSPSIIVLSFLLAPRSFRRATTATGSVALSSPPNKKDVFQLQLYGKVSCGK